MEDEIAKTYAKAIYDIAKSSNKIDEVREVLNILIEKYSAEEQFRRILENPIIKFSEKEEFLKKSFSFASAESIKVVRYIIKKNRLSSVAKIKAKFLEIYYKENNKLPVTAIFAKKLSNEQEKKLTKKLEKKYNKKIVLNLVVDKSIIGGGIIKVNDEIIDGSIKNQISDMKKVF